MERKVILKSAKTSSIKSSTSIYTRFVTLNTFIQDKFENTRLKKKKKKAATVVKLQETTHA